MDFKLKHIHEPGKNYRIRGCVPVALVLTPVPGSVIKQCDECGTDVWFDPSLSIPEPDDGTVIEGDVNLCVSCLRFHIAIDQDPAVWLGPKPPGFD